MTANCFITGSQLLADEYESSHKNKVSKCEISSRSVMKYDYLCKCIFFFGWTSKTGCSQFTKTFWLSNSNHFLNISGNFWNTTSKQFHFSAFHIKNVIMKIHVNIEQFSYTMTQKYKQALIRATSTPKVRVKTNYTLLFFIKQSFTSGDHPDPEMLTR